ncbi:MAG: (Fe-S)-binding protein, partial [Duodenibacillus sp.]|nr:(Fe-S)-binding protein [Duodenibacillus sp.]
MTQISRKDFFRAAGAAAVGLAAPGLAQAAAPASPITRQAPVVGSRLVTASEPGSRARVYFTPAIDAEHLIRLYGLVSGGIHGRVAVKLHTGEKNGPNILPRDMVKALIAAIPDST